MCSYADQPYTTGIAVYADQPLTVLEGYVFATPIRDRVVCMSGPAEPHVVLIGNDSLSAYLDLYVVSIQVILLAVLLIGLPIFFIQKLKMRKQAITSTVLGILFSALIIYATTNHVGWQLILPWMILISLSMLVPSYWIYGKSSKLVH